MNNTGSCSRRECDAREEIISKIRKAKRDVGFPLGCDFFKDVWPVAIGSMKDITDVAMIAHAGGLQGMSEADALIEIRKITTKYWTHISPTRNQ